jgi:phosphotransferase system enzyme I (PtsI)
MPKNNGSEIILKGIGGSPGICIGKAYLVDSEGVKVVPKYYIADSAIENEINRFKAAVKKSNDEIKEIIDNTPEEYRQRTQILETHTILMKDKMLYGRILDTIGNERVNAEWALKKTVAYVKPMFESMTDSYLRERADDIVQISERIMKNLMGAEQIDIGKIDKRVILVAHDLSPAETSQIQLERIKGFVTDRGGKDSHTAIIARSLAIPAVLGLAKATTVIRNDDIIIVDGTTGTVVVNPTEKTLMSAEDRRSRYETYKADIARQSHLPACTLDEHRLPVLGNIELPEEVVSVIDNGGEGIGLVRTEFLYLSRRNFPGEEELLERLKDIIEVMPHQPVTIRTLDINGDKIVSYTGDRNELNPALGLRAIRYCLRKPDVFKTQLRAILRAGTYGDVRVMFPMISGLEEVRQAKAQLAEAAASLESDGLAHQRNMPVGVMLEVPSAVMAADHIAEEVDFFSIGTNDLIQYSLAIDRGNCQVAHLYQPLHPAILRMLKQICDVTRAADIKVAMCGEMAGDPFYVPLLLGLGIDELSMNPPSIPAVKSMIRAVALEDCKALAHDVFQLKTAAEINLLVKERFGAVLAQHLYSDIPDTGNANRPEGNG